MNIGIILQARMNSSRLPGKVLRPLAGVPMLHRILDRLGRCRTASLIVVATSDQPQDDAVAKFAAEAGVAVFRGSECDVLDRYYRCARTHGFDIVVRATADNPFVDSEEGDRLVAFLDAERLEYAVGSGLPTGVALEAMTFAALERSWREGLAPHHREHVNEYILENPGLFPQGQMDAPQEKRAPHLRLTVDTPEDLARAEALHSAFRAEGGKGEPDTAWLVRVATRLA